MIELPKEFLDTITQELAQALDTASPVSIRYNPFKNTPTTLTNRVPWCNSGYYLDERPIFTIDPLFHGGAYYVQESSSMFVGWIVEQLGIDRPRILDLCAAPGGKTTHLSCHASVVVANEVIRQRAKILSENVQRWGNGNIAVTSNDPRDFGERLPSFFDIVVIDTPCSGEGMFRKDHAAREQWSPEAVELCASRSRRIVSDSWGSLRDGGVLIYSTCTFNRHENEDNAAWICSELGGELIPLENVPSGIVSDGVGYHFYPNLVRGEGFYAVAIRKNGNETRAEYTRKKSKNDLAPLTKDEQAELSRWVGTPLNFAIGGGNVYGFTDELFSIIELLRADFNLLYSGVMMGEMIRGSLKPSHPLATYYDVRFDNRTELKLDDAVKYLRRDTLSVDLFENDGLTLVTYQNCPLGWLKRIGNRTNNLYPQQQRILHF